MKKMIEVWSCGTLVKIPVQGVPSVQEQQRWIEPWNAGVLLGFLGAVITLWVVTYVKGVPV